MVCLFDCCHSGTMMDLPYIFSANGEAVEALSAGENLQMAVNPGFNLAYAQQLIAQIARGLVDKVLKRDGADASSADGIKGIVSKVAQTVMSSSSQPTAAS